MPSTLTTPPRRDNPFDLSDTVPSLDDRTAWRRWATRESYPTAMSEVPAAGPLIPEASDAQATAEAQIMAALIDEYGMHRPYTTEGPYGVVSVTPRRHVLRIRISSKQLPRWFRVLTTALGSPRSTGLPVEVTDDGLALAVLGARIELLGVTEAQWQSVVASTPAEAGARRPLDESLTRQMSATLRRIGLLWDVAERYSTVELLLAEHAGASYLLDASPGPHGPSVIPLWTALSLPLELWPCPPAPAVIDARAAVLAAVNAAHPSRAATDPVLALCYLADVEAAEASLRAAEHALTVAQSVLTDPTYTSVWDGGGWAGNCRRRDGSEKFVAHVEEFLPPGTEILLMAPETDIVELGHVVLRPHHTELGPERLVGDEVHEVPLSWGTSAYIDLLDWALAAATSPPPREVSPAQLRAVDDDGGLRAAASRAAVQITEAHEAIESAAKHSKHRQPHTHRLVQQVRVAADADPSFHDLILAAHERDVLSIIPLLESLTYLWGKVFSAAGASDGHWNRDEDGEFPHSFTGTISCWTDLPPATLSSEEANTSSVDSASFRRHLAAHRAALDPFVSCYLAAADSATGTQDFEDRHRAGVEALRRADLPALQALDPRQPPRDNGRFLRFLATLPLGLHELDAWFDTVYPSGEAAA
ncbi:hypothetical protein OG413_43675 [Streptomyces sp. NBC_01433]|uniref:hypothetical protein n=1 Tax=Streptomyces sp. NBC_01433 TaxID=2903864 RepID=UPI002253E02F|nr:hypothetical protein [Streptomyces sp. NBC_01433]MCX4682085.1 hypothetical protein [Streptomyces sp. NBC_01433]